MRFFGRLGLVVAAAVLVLPASASALANFTWSGASSDPNWSNTANWVGASAPSGAVGTLTFPQLTGAACTADPPTASCYSSNNDTSGLSASALSIDDGAGYDLGGNGLTLGAGGLSASTANPVTGNAVLGLAITLGASQAWSIDGDSVGVGVSVVNGLSGTGSALSADLAHRGLLGLGGDNEVGTFSAVGADSTQSGQNAQTNGAVDLTGATSLNGTDGHPVDITHAGLLVGPGASIGPLVLSGAAFEMSSGVSTVDGGVSIDSATTTFLAVNQPGTTPGTDYSQISASGTVSLNGSLLLGDFGGAWSCPSLNVGDVDTLITTSGTLSGTFAGVPDGTVMSFFGCQTGPTVRINYTAHSVTATVLTAGEPASRVTLAASPSNPVTNQSVTLTATITAQTGTPSGGSVAFGTPAGPFHGCQAQPVSWSGTSGTATCQTSFAADASPEDVYTQFTPTNASVQGSLGGPIRLSIGPDSTATALAVSNAAPTPGQSVTYTATVTPADAGPAAPSGTVQFLDGGAPISGCSAQPVSNSSSSCMVSYSGTGSHTITAVYSGDANFTGSASPAQTVNVQAPAPAPAPTPTPTPTPPPPTPPGPSASQILAAVSSALAPSGKGARIGALLSHGGYAFTFTAPSPGTLTISWYFVPPGAHVSKGHKPKPVVIASARVTFSKAGAARVTVRLTAAGKRMLKHATTLRVVGKAGFRPTGGTATSKTRRFTLRR